MKKRVFFAAVVSIYAFLFGVDTVVASSLKVEPLSYDVQLAAGELKKGFIDISNPAASSVTVTVEVQGFRQVDDRGSLEFYDDPVLAAAVTPDYRDISLGSREAMRLFFLVDGTKLPQGDLFAALFVRTIPDADGIGTSESVRLGTLLTIVNGTGGPREAVVEQLAVNWWQIGAMINGRFTVRNPAPDGSGFYPDVTIRLTPFGGETVQRSSLVMAGRQRENQFTIEGDRLGVYRLSVSHGASERSRWVMVVTGYWQWLLPLIVVVIMMFFVSKRHTKKRARSYYKAR